MRTVFKWMVNRAHHNFTRAGQEVRHVIPPDLGCPAHHILYITHQKFDIVSRNGLFKSSERFLSSEASIERSNMTLKVTISSVEWCFFTRYERKINFSWLFFIEYRKWYFFFWSNNTYYKNTHLRCFLVKIFYAHLSTASVIPLMRITYLYIVSSKLEVGLIVTNLLFYI